jgi:hypothetical protein
MSEVVEQEEVVASVNVDKVEEQHESNEATEQSTTSQETTDNEQQQNSEEQNNESRLENATEEQIQPEQEEQSMERPVVLSEEERIFQLRMEIERLALETQEQELRMRTLDPELAERILVEQHIHEQEQEELAELAIQEKLFDQEEPHEEQVIEYVDAETAFKMRVEFLMREYYEENPPIEPDPSDLPMSQDELAEIIEDLEEKRRNLEEEGFYLEAQQVMNKIKEVNLVEGQKFEILFKYIQHQALQEVLYRHRVEMLVFDEIWSEKVTEYERQAKEIILSSIERQKWERNETEQHIRSQLYQLKPKFSKQVLNMKSQLQRLVKQKMYEEADSLRRNLKPLELKEIAQFEQLQENKVQVKMNFVKNRHSQELEALKQRILKGKTELLHQKNQDQKRLEQSHANIMQEFTAKQKRVLTKTKQFIGKQSAVLLTSPRKSAVDFSLLKFGSSTFDKYLSSPALSPRSPSIHTRY